MKRPALTLDELVAGYAAGRLPRPLALAVATHLALSPACREPYRRYEAAGGLLLERIEPVPLAGGSWERLLDCLDEVPEPPASTEPAPEALARIPRPLRDLIPGSLEALHWRRLGAVAEAELERTPGFRTSLFWLRAGRSVPAHTHEGNEITLVLEGGLRDAFGHYRRGDLAIADASIEHQPMADPDEDCLCLGVLDARLRLTGRAGRLISPFLPFDITPD